MICEVDCGCFCSLAAVHWQLFTGSWARNWAGQFRLVGQMGGICEGIFVLYQAVGTPIPDVVQRRENMSRFLNRL